jgi:hypothetical protein
MKLRMITEDLRGSQEPVREAGRILADLIQYVYTLDDSEEKAAIESFLQSPNPRSWEQAKWVIDSFARKAVQGKDRQLQKQVKDWAQLKQLESPTVSASLFDIEPKELRGTPAQHVAMIKPYRDKLKQSLGPEGYVRAMADLGRASPHDVKKILKATAKSGDGLLKAAQADLPGVEPVRKF